jgi:Arc/MetJ family transcription regulator
MTKTTIRLDTDLADEAVRLLGAKSRGDAVHIALREIVGLRRLRRHKTSMKKNSGKLRLAGLDEESYERARQQAMILLNRGFHLGGVIRATRDE